MNEGIEITRSAYDVLESARKDAELNKTPYITPEHVLYQIESAGALDVVLSHNSMAPCFFRERLEFFLSSLISVESTSDYSLLVSDSLRYAIEVASYEGSPVGIPQLLIGISQLNDSLAGYLLRKYPKIINDFGVSICSQVDLDIRLLEQKSAKWLRND